MDSNEENFFNEDSNAEEKFDLREYLLDLAEKKEIDATPSAVKKASEKNLQKIYDKHRKKQLQDTNEMICDIVIAKTSGFLETIGWIKSANETAKKLQSKKLFMRDFSNLMAHITPYIPFLGFVEGGISVGEDMASHAVNTVIFPKSEEEKNPSSEEEKTQL